MGTYELEKKVSRLEAKWRSFCCFVRSCLNISSTGDPDLVLNQQGDWITGGGGSSYYLYSENYDSGTFAPSTVTGLNAVSIGVANDASGDYSTTIGGGNTASGLASYSLGASNTSSGHNSISIGVNNTSTGNASTAMGNSTTASGDYSTSMGSTTTALSYVETSLGLNNTTYIPISDTTFELTDRLFGVGNGDGSNSDAFTILKNAKVGIDIDNFETTTSEAKLQVNGYINAVLNVYANHAAADADTDLKTNDFYKLTGDRTVYQKP